MKNGKQGAARPAGNMPQALIPSALRPSALRPSAQRPSQGTTLANPVSPLRRRRRELRGFTLLELIVVVAVVGILAAIAMPNLINTPRRAKEAVLKTNLRTIREVIDQHYGDKGAYPPTLEALVEEGYLRDVPIDPMTGEVTWGEVFDTDLAGADGGIDPIEADFADGGGGEPGIIDVFSLSPDASLDGQPYSEW